MTIRRYDDTRITRALKRKSLSGSDLPGGSALLATGSQQTAAPRINFGQPSKPLGASKGSACGVSGSVCCRLINGQFGALLIRRHTSKQLNAIMQRSRSRELATNLARLSRDRAKINWHELVGHFQPANRQRPTILVCVYANSNSNSNPALEARGVRVASLASLDARLPEARSRKSSRKSLATSRRTQQARARRARRIRGANCKPLWLGQESRR